MEKTATANSPATETKPTASKRVLPGWAKKIKSTEVGAFVLGLTAYNLFFTKLQQGRPEPHDIPGAEPPGDGAVPSMQELETVVQESGKVATAVNDDMSFGEAFQASRQELGPGNFFWWRGRFYNNFTEGEWYDLTDAEQVAFVQQTGKFDTDEMAVETEGPASEPSAEPREYAGDTDQSSDNGTEFNQFSEQNNQQTMEYIDIDNDGKDDAVLINVDDDPSAEIVQHWGADGTSYALVDTGNTGMLDTLYLVDEDGNLYNPMPLEEEIPAPKLAREQHLDLIGNDGILDSLARDTKGDARADEVHVDMNNDGSYDVAYFDTTGDGRLDKVCKIENGRFTDPVSLNEPFEAPIVGAIAGGAMPANSQGVPPAAHEGESLFAQSPDEQEIPGLDNDADIGEFH